MGQTGGILAPADLDKLLDIRDFLRHSGRACRREMRWSRNWVAVVVAVAVFGRCRCVEKLGEAETLSAGCEPPRGGARRRL